MSLDTPASLPLHSRVFGHGPEQALALHCSLAHSGAWKGIAGALEDDLSIQALDLPSHGRSPDWDGTGDLTEASLKAVLPYLDRPMHLIGHSYGGVLALMLALERPEFVKSISVYEPVLMAVANEDAPELGDWNREHMREVNGHIKAGDPAMAARLFMRVWGDGRRWDDLPAELREGSTRRITFIGDSQPAIMEDNQGVVARLGNIKVPLLVMDGGASPELMHIVQEGIAARVEGAVHRRFEGQAHMGPVTNPKDVAAEILSNIRRATP